MSCWIRIGGRCNTQPVQFKTLKHAVKWALESTAKDDVTTPWSVEWDESEEGTRLWHKVRHYAGIGRDNLLSFACDMELDIELL
jgi:hypothetical protein